MRRVKLAAFVDELEKIAADAAVLPDASTIGHALAPTTVSARPVSGAKARNPTLKGIRETTAPGLRTDALASRLGQGPLPGQAPSRWIKMQNVAQRFGRIVAKGRGSAGGF
jgi:hypothetical protein